MKKIAVPCEGNQISQHFGHCAEYTIFECEDRKIKKRKVIPNPGHQPDFLPGYLNDLGVECILAGGMGVRAVNLFKNNGIEVITGVTGLVDDAAKMYLEGRLETEDNVCNH